MKKELHRDYLGSSAAHDFYSVVYEGQIYDGQAVIMIDKVTGEETISTGHVAV